MNPAPTVLIVVLVLLAAFVVAYFAYLKPNAILSLGFI